MNETLNELDGKSLVEFLSESGVEVSGVTAKLKQDQTSGPKNNRPGFQSPRNSVSSRPRKLDITRAFTRSIDLSDFETAVPIDDPDYFE